VASGGIGTLFSSAIGPVSSLSSIFTIIAPVFPDLGRIRLRYPGIADLFQGDRAFETARGSLKAGDGIGEPVPAEFNNLLSPDLQLRSVA
jgi:hypothetical protein